MKRLLFVFFSVAFLIFGCGGDDGQSLSTPNQVEDAEAVESSGKSIEAEEQTNDIS